MLNEAKGKNGNDVANYEIIEEIIEILAGTELSDHQLEKLWVFTIMAIKSNNVRITRLLLESGLINFNFTLIESWLKPGTVWAELSSCPKTISLLLQYADFRMVLAENIVQVLFYIVPIGLLKIRDKSDDDIISTVKMEAPYQRKGNEWIKEEVERRIKRRDSSLASIQAEVDEFLDVILQCDAVLSALFRMGRHNMVFDGVNILEAPYYGPCLAKVKEVYAVYEIVNNPHNQCVRVTLSVMDRVSPGLLWYYIGRNVSESLDFSLIVSYPLLPIKVYRDKILKHPRWLEWKEIIQTFILCMNQKVILRDENIAPIPSELIRIVSLHGACQTFDSSYGWPAKLHFPLLKALHSFGDAGYAKVDKLFRVK